MSGPICNASCPVCGDVKLEASDITLVVSDQPWYGWDCYACADYVTKPATEDVVRLLTTAAHITPLVVIDDAPPLTEDDLIRFGLALEAGAMGEMA